MRSVLVVVTLLASSSLAQFAEAATVSGKVVTVSASRLADTWSEWGTVVIRPSVGPWLTAWVTSTVPEETGRRILEMGGRATSNFQITFRLVDQNPAWAYWYSVTNFSSTELRRVTAVPAATLTGSGNAVQIVGQVSRILQYGDTSLVYIGNQGYSVSISRASQHYSRLFTTALGAADADKDLTFYNVGNLGFGQLGSYDGTSANSYKARNQ